MSVSISVTVLMAVYNGAEYIDDAIRSILAQSYRDFELLIVDDGSSDATADRVAAHRDPRIRLVHNPTNVGLTKSLNRGLSLARAPLIARHDADDMSHPHRLARQVHFLRKHPEVAVVGTQARAVDMRGRSIGAALWPKATAHTAIRWQVMFDSPFVHGSVMYRKSIIWSTLGGYDEQFTASQDFELWCRVAAGGYGMRNLHEQLIDFRVHDASVSAQYEAQAVAKLRRVLLDSFSTQIGGEPPDGWPDAWIHVNNPRLFPDVGARARRLGHSLEVIRSQFTERNPASARDPEIRQHLAAMLLRIANRGAVRGDVSSAAAFLRAWHFDRDLAVRVLPRYVGHVCQGLLLRNRRLPHVVSRRRHGERP